MLKINDLFPVLKSFVSKINPDQISKERKAALQVLIDYIQYKINERKDIRLNFVCTHNSRRSHFSQIWAQTLAYYFGIKNICCYSAGTEATAIYPMVITTLANSGFQISQLSESPNPIYSIKFAENEHPIIGFSKQLDDSFNPKNNFAAIMTCSQANENCPYIVGAEKRIPITFEDPKAFDNTPQQTEKYAERSWQIVSELFYVFSQIKV